jgi:hypothetical protein
MSREVEAWSECHLRQRNGKEDGRDRDTGAEKNAS